MPSTIPVSDSLSNLNDQLANAAGIIGRSKHRQAIFSFIYGGQKQLKTVKEIMKATKLSQTHVLKEGGKMAGFLIEKVNGGYKKKREFSTLYKRILSLARDKKKLSRLPTKTSPKSINNLRIKVSFPSRAQNAHQITLEDIDSFSKTKNAGSVSLGSISEKKIKNAFKHIIREKGSFKDWGGEKSDLYSTQVLMGHKRVPTAIAFKGRGTKGKLVPAKMGKNGDQIGRLFDEPARLFLVVYKDQIDSSIVSQMQAFAIGKAIGGQKIYYGVVDGNDLGKIASAYPKSFK